MLHLKSFDFLHLCFVDIKLFCQNYVAKFDSFNFQNNKNFCESEIEKNFSFLLSKEEKFYVGNFKSFKRQAEWISSRYAIKHLLKKHKGRKFEDLTVLNHDNGAPYIENLNINFSISHSHKYAVALFSSKDNVQIGIDIEKIVLGKAWKPISKIAFSLEEIKHLKSCDSFYKNWTIKEAFLKMIKTGFATPLKEVKIIEDKIYYKDILKKDVKIISQILDENYIYSIVYSKPCFVQRSKRHIT